MPGDLSSYINFNVELDIRNRVSARWILTDNGTYPFGVAAGITGIFKIIQPDGGVYNGSWASPDVVYASGALQPASIILRLATGLTVQPGTYIIVYTIDHASYSPTTLTKTFTITYTSPVPVLTPSIDVFVPIIGITDETVYTASGYTIGSLTRAWSVVVGTVGTVTGTSATQDVGISGNYYDAAYAATLVANFVGLSTTYSYLTIRDRLTTIDDFDAWTPPNSITLRGYLTTLKARLDALVNTDEPYDDAKKDYEYAYVLYMHIKVRVCSGDTVGVWTYIQEILDILHYHTVIPNTHTNAAIAGYDYGALCSTTGTGGIQSLYYIADGTETQESFPSVYFHWLIPSLIGKTILLASVDGLVRKVSQGGTPFLPPTPGELYFETDLGKLYWSQQLYTSTFFQILYYTA